MWEKYWDMRNKMLKGRDFLPMCKQCDVFLLFPQTSYSLKKISPKNCLSHLGDY